MNYYCKVCDKTYKKFIIFEGHFDFNDKCRANHPGFLECYFCREKFLHLATLKYHLRQHAPLTPKYIRQIPKVETKKHETSEIIVPTFRSDEECNENGSYKEDESIRTVECKICKKTFRSSFYLEQHLIGHSKKRIRRTVRIKRVPIMRILGIQGANVRIKTPARSSNLLIKTDSTNRKRYYCKLCDVVCSSENHFATHEKIHTDGKFKCEICNVKFSRRSLIRHQIISHGKITNRKCGKISNRKCNICKTTFANRRNLASHAELHKNGKFKCDICKAPFTKQSLVWHKMHSHKDGTNTVLESSQPEAATSQPKTTFKSNHCKTCNTTCSNSTFLAAHTQFHKYGKYKCEKCQIRFTLSSLVSHQKRFHPEIPLQFGKQRCKVCEIMCFNKLTMDAHVKMHNEGKYKCEICEIKFTFHALEKHKRLQHPKPMIKHECTICKGSFSTFSNLGQHMKVHIIGDIKCEICHIRFTRQTLSQHQKLSHPNSDLTMSSVLKQNKRDIKRLQRTSSQFQCTFCKLFFGDTKKLELHLKVHTEGDLQCEDCKIPFTKASLAAHDKRFHSDVPKKGAILKALERHMTNEANESDESKVMSNLKEEYERRTASQSKFQCIICQLACFNPAKLDVHIKVHIKGEYKCEVCNVWFTKQSLESHQRRCHFELYEERMTNGTKLAKEQISVTNLPDKARRPLYKCNICQSQCATQEKLIEHKKGHFTGKVKCERCLIRFRPNALSFHQRKMHPDMPRKDRFSKVKCNICSFICYASSLEDHMRVHSEGDLNCEICNIPFTKRSLEMHNRRDHPHILTNNLFEKALERNIIAKNNPFITYNVSNQESGSAFPCEICKKPCEDKKKRDAHMKVHVYGDIKCEICQIWFTKPSLDYHYKRFHPEVPIEKKEKDPHPCEICKMKCYDASRLKIHVKVHTDGDINCHVCGIKFTKPSLVYHYKVSHPEVPKSGRILRAIENCDTKKPLHNCSECGKSFTRLIYLKLHMKVHRNGIKDHQISIDFENDVSLDNQQLESDICGQLKPETQTDSSTYECYICKTFYPNGSCLNHHLSQHIVYQQWVDPLNVYLSNWNPEESREILLNQPLVLVENLDIETLNLKSLSDFGQRSQNCLTDLLERNLSLMDDSVPANNIENLFNDENEFTSVEPQIDFGLRSQNCLPNLLEKNASLIESNIASNIENELNYVAPQNDYSDCIEIASDEDDGTTINEIKNNELLKFQSFSNLTQNYMKRESDVKGNFNLTTDEFVLYVSSESEDDDETNVFHCYFCNRRFKTLPGLGDHVTTCKYDPTASQN